MSSKRVTEVSLKGPPTYGNPPDAPETIDAVLEVNEELIKVCSEFQAGHNAESLENALKVYKRIEKNLHFLTERLEADRKRSERRRSRRGP